MYEIQWKSSSHGLQVLKIVVFVIDFRENVLCHTTTGFSADFQFYWIPGPLDTSTGHVEHSFTPDGQVRNVRSVREKQQRCVLAAINVQLQNKWKKCAAWNLAKYRAQSTLRSVFSPAMKCANQLFDKQFKREFYPKLEQAREVKHCELNKKTSPTIDVFQRQPVLITELWENGIS